MWLARCNYVAKLIDPRVFATAMHGPSDPCWGRGRFASEHWVLSHPHAAPRDLFPDKSYVWKYSHAPEGDFSKSLKAAPRFDLPAYVLPGQCSDRYQGLAERLIEYELLFHERPPPSWWGWYFFGSATMLQLRLPPLLKKLPAKRRP